MNLEAALNRKPAPTRDREVIRMDFGQDKLGIAAALRQAFAVAAHEPCDVDFDRLLRELQ